MIITSEDLSLLKNGSNMEKRKILDKARDFIKRYFVKEYENKKLLNDEIDLKIDEILLGFDSYFIKKLNKFLEIDNINITLHSKNIDYFIHEYIKKAEIIESLKNHYKQIINNIIININLITEENNFNKDELDLVIIIQSQPNLFSYFMNSDISFESVIIILNSIENKLSILTENRNIQNFNIPKEILEASALVEDVHENKM